ncbi:MAG: hypothetical protein JWL90_2800 [Chthoniobacteraceae bacterium]|nr:hypothetical protein [Chthoniobacteraceae bacterium]
MKTIVSTVILLTCLHSVIHGETVEMTAGPDLTVSYDPGTWKPLAPLRRPEPGAFQSMTWAFQNPEWAEMTITSHPGPKKEAEFKQEVIDTQKFRGDPAEFVRERRESIAGREWLVLEFRNANTRPPRSETHYFLTAADGYATLFLVAEEASLPTHRGAIDAFIRTIRLK